MGPGGRSYFGDAIVELFNPLGTQILRRNALGTGSSLNESISPVMAGTYRMVVTTTASATDFGGGGFSGGEVTGWADFTVTAIPAPGAGALAAAGIVAAMRRRR